MVTNARRVSCCLASYVCTLYCVLVTGHSYLSCLCSCSLCKWIHYTSHDLLLSTLTDVATRSGITTTWYKLRWNKQLYWNTAKQEVHFLNEGIKWGGENKCKKCGAMIITGTSAGYWPAESSLSLSEVQSLMAWPLWQPAEWKVWVEPLRPQTNQWVSLWQMGGYK